jgi:hypothetical protein
MLRNYRYIAPSDSIYRTTETAQGGVLKIIQSLNLVEIPENLPDE